MCLPEREACRSKQEITRQGRLGSGMLQAEKSHSQCKETEASEWVWKCSLVYSPFLYIVNSYFLILKVIYLYFRIFRKYRLKKTQNKDLRQFLTKDHRFINVLVYDPYYLFAKCGLKFFSTKMWAYYALFWKLLFNNISVRFFHINYSPQFDF